MIDYNQILADLVSLLTAQVAGFKLVIANVDSQEFHYANLPICDVRLSGGIPEPTAGQVYYTPTVFELEIAAHSLRSQAEAATIALDLLRNTQNALKANAHYGAVWDSIILGQFDMVTGEENETLGKGAFLASIVTRVTINVYSQ